MFKPAMEVYANKDSFTGRSIESLGMSFQPVTERYRPWTSETAQVASKAMNVLGDKATLSPVQIQHLVRGYFGWLGTSVLGATDMLVTRNLLDTPEKPDWRLDEYPVLKAFMEQTPKRHAKYASEFYENMRTVNQAYNAMKQYRKDNNHEAVKKSNAEHGEQFKHRHLFSREARKISKINKTIAVIYKSRILTGAQKKERIDKLNKRKNDIYKRASERTRSAFN